MNEWKPYIIALSVGLIVGIERENANIKQNALGVRTFILIGFLGAIAGGLQMPYLEIVIALFTLGLVVVSYYIQIYSKLDHVHMGLTTEFAAGIVFLAGYLAHRSPILAAMVGPFVAVILVSRATLHRFTHAIKPLELKAAVMILLIAAVVIDLVPDTAIDPWGFLNPRKFGYLILILACLEFFSYIALKFIGEKKRSLVVGLLGGLVSSTAVLISSARQAAKIEGSNSNLVFMALAAQVASLIELLLVVCLVSPVLFLEISILILPALIFGGVVMFVLGTKAIEAESNLELNSPLNLPGVIRLSVVFTLVLASISAAKRLLGHGAILTLSFLTGLFELQGVSLANATLYSLNQLSAEVAGECIYLAVVASLAAKIVISWFFGRNKFAVTLSLVFFPMILLILGFAAWSSSPQGLLFKEALGVK